QWRDTKTAAIVDFMPRTYKIYADVKKELLDNGHIGEWDEIHSNLLSKYYGERRLEIAKKWLQEWDLLSKIDEAVALIKNERDRTKMLENGFTRIEESKYTLTDDLDEYLDAVKDNVKNLTSALGLDV
ncbi:hypothetical protein FO519_010672, partial [Halicephalobus sp. NKZ332]